MIRKLTLLFSATVFSALTFTAIPALAASEASYQACLGANGVPLTVEDSNADTSKFAAGSAATMKSCNVRGTNTLEVLIQRIATTLIFAAGAIAVVIMIIGGLGYVTSTGDPARIKKAKDTILYAVMGLIVALLAYAIVGFVVTRI